MLDPDIVLLEKNSGLPESWDVVYYKEIRSICFIGRAKWSKVNDGTCIISYNIHGWFVSYVTV